MARRRPGFIQVEASSKGLQGAGAASDCPRERKHLQMKWVVYIDLNMVRAGVVEHPAPLEVGGYHEIA